MCDVSHGFRSPGFPCTMQIKPRGQPILCNEKIIYSNVLLNLQHNLEREKPAGASSDECELNIIRIVEKRSKDGSHSNCLGLILHFQAASAPTGQRLTGQRLKTFNFSLSRIALFNLQYCLGPHKSEGPLRSQQPQAAENGLLG
jgi:hypothetical protein